MFGFFYIEPHTKTIQHKVKTKENGDVYVEQNIYIDGALGRFEYIDTQGDVELPTLADKSVPIVNKFSK